jgi:hypothetical protein
MRPALYPILFGGGFSLDQFMGRQSAGLYYDFTKTDRLFQENVGPTLADDVGEAIGLALDQRQWGGSTLAGVLAGQSELVTNGGFDSDTVWTKQSGTISGGKLNGSNAAQLAYQNIGLVVGKIYRLQFDYTMSAGIGIRANNSTTNGAAIMWSGTLGASGTITAYVVATTGGILCFEASGANFTGTIDNVSVKLVPGIPAIQATGTLKPTLQTTGAKYDGSDDNHLTSYVAGSGANFIVALVTVPASIAVTQIMAGAIDASSNRIYVGFGVDGIFAAALGTQTLSTIKGSQDRRGAEVVVGLSFDGSSVRLFDDQSQSYSAAQSGNATTTVAFRLGARNASGTADSVFAGSIKRLVAGREFLTLSRYNQIRNALLAA